MKSRLKSGLQRAAPNVDYRPSPRDTIAMAPNSPRSDASAPLRRAKLRRRWFQFSIRSLLAVTFLVAALFAFWVRPAVQQRRNLEALRGHYTYITYDVPRDSRGNPCPRFVPGWLVDALGIDFFANVTGLEVYNATDDVLRRLSALPRLNSLMLHGTDFTTADGMAYVGSLTQLQVLALPHMKTTDAGIAHLWSLKKLALLELSDTRVTDAGLMILQGLPELRSLYLSDTSVTDEGLARFRQAAPHCTVKRTGHLAMP